MRTGTTSNSTQIKKPTDQEYHDAAISLALDLVIIVPCEKCGWPIQSGWCCRRCGCSQ